MTTPAAERQYLAEHLAHLEGKGFAVFNPHNKPLEDLSVIYGFNNGGSSGCLAAIAIAEDGTPLGNHVCSAEAYMPYDLGMLEGTRPDRHEKEFQPHYPGGYRMEFVPSEEIKTHEGLKKAFGNNEKLIPQEA